MNRDSIKLIALELDLPTLINLCNTSKKFNDFICKDKLFWKNKLNKDYPNTRNKFSKDFRKIYTSLFNKKKNEYAIFRKSDEPIDFFNIVVKNFEHDEEAYEKVEEILNEDIIAAEDVFEFEMIGEFPKGTEIWISYDSETSVPIKGFLTQDEALNHLLSEIKTIFIYDLEEGMEGLIVDDMEKPDDTYSGNYYKFVKENQEYIDSKKEEYIIKYYVSKNIDDVLKDAKKKLLENGIYKLYNSQYNNYDVLIIKKFIL